MTGRLQPRLANSSNLSPFLSNGESPAVIGWFLSSVNHEPPAENIIPATNSDAGMVSIQAEQSRAEYALA